MAGEMMLIDARLMPATAVIVRVIGRFIVFSFDERAKKRVARKPLESTQRFNGARSVASTDGAARACQVLRLACIAQDYGCGTAPESHRTSPEFQVRG